jgi:5'-3' exonuclease
MGIHLLTTFLRNLRENGSYKTSLSKLSGKRIVVDASIYLYRFKAMDALIENIYLLCTLFRVNDISALFVFDGKSMKNKTETILKRKEQRDAAKREYFNIMKRVENLSPNDREEQEEKMTQLRRKFVKVTYDDIKEVKGMLDAYGIKYITAINEADEVCSAIVIKGAAYACLSEDTDLFAYGCPRVLKYISLLNHTVVVYPLEKILESVGMKFTEFRQLCILSGTDYNESHRNIFTFYKLFTRYKQRPNTLDFVSWLSLNNKITLRKYYQVKDVFDIYNKNPSEILNKIRYCLIKNRAVNKPALKHILSNNGFIFVN